MPSGREFRDGPQAVAEQTGANYNGRQLLYGHFGSFALGAHPVIHSLRWSVATALLLGALVAVRAQESPRPGAIEGTVRDAAGVPVAGATVHRETDVGNLTAVAATDTKGFYRFVTVRAGRFTIGAEKPGFRSSSAGPFNFGSGETKAIDITLKPSSSGDQGSRAPEFYDEPQFTVAGVADIANHGGHGSDTVSRTAQVLAKDIASTPAAVANGARPSLSDEQTLRMAVARSPENFQANQRLGLSLQTNGKGQEALEYLERAHSMQPSDYTTALALTRAYLDSGQAAQADQTARALLKAHDTAELHVLLGDIEEKRGSSVQAVEDYQRAAELDPSEANLFAWGAELLLHRALEPALQVFGKGSRRYPASSRMLVGLGVAHYASGSPELAARMLCRASDLDPSSATPYLVLGKMQVLDPPGTASVTEKMERFVRLFPENALANYYYAVALQRRSEADPEQQHRIEALLKRSLELNPSFAPALLQLGALYQGQNQWPQATTAYEKAVALDSELAEAHYRLAQAYRHAGEPGRAEQELARSDQVTKKNLEKAAEESQQIPQFVYTLRHPQPSPQ